MKTEKRVKASSVGVIVARFQVPELTAGHRHLIDFVRARHHRVLIVLGECRTRSTGTNPLSYELRAAMLASEYPEVRVASIRDNRSDVFWSEALDTLIGREFPGAVAVLYGSRDSFLPYYHGVFDKRKVGSCPSPTGTACRNISIASHFSADFRRGVIYASASKAPQVYQTVDVAVVDRGRVLLAGKKEDDGKLRFIGGFVDAKDESREVAAARECAEETGAIGVHRMEYLGSRQIDDWRYRGTGDVIQTAILRAR